MTEAGFVKIIERATKSPTKLLSSGLTSPKVGRKSKKSYQNKKNKRKSQGSSTGCSADAQQNEPGGSRAGGGSRPDTPPSRQTEGPSPQPEVRVSNDTDNPRCSQAKGGPSANKMKNSLRRFLSAARHLCNWFAGILAQLFRGKQSSPRSL